MNEERKEYFKEYFKNNKSKYALYKRLAYWRNKARMLCEDEKTIMSMDIVELKKLCAEHLN